MSDDDVVVGTPPVEEKEPSIQIDAETAPVERVVPKSFDDWEPANETEREASESGWVPKEYWKGDPKRWRDAGPYVDQRNHVLPLVQKENRGLREKNQALEERLARLEQMEVERSAAREQLSVETLKIERRQAYEEQNWDRVTELDDKLIKAAVKESAKAAPQQPQIDPRVNQIWEDFRAENEWVKAPDAQQVLMEKMVVMRQAGSTLNGRELLEKAKERVRREYPEFFPSSKKQMAESGGFNGASRSQTRTWSDLKPEVVQAWSGLLNEKGITKQGLLKQAAENPSMYFKS